MIVDNSMIYDIIVDDVLSYSQIVLSKHRCSIVFADHSQYMLYDSITKLYNRI